LLLFQLPNLLAELTDLIPLPGVLPPGRFEFFLQLVNFSPQSFAFSTYGLSTSQQKASHHRQT
jgi:hypothetical protein